MAITILLNRYTSCFIIMIIMVERTIYIKFSLSSKYESFITVMQRTYLYLQ